MTIEECYERVQEQKRRIRSITVEQTIAANLAAENLGGLCIDVLKLDKEQEQLSAIILEGGDTDQVVGVDCSADCS